MERYLYDIFQTSGKNHCSDLNIALAMLLSDAKTGVQEYGPDGLDYQALHQDYEALMEAEGGLRRFMGRHGEKLARAYQTKNRQTFDAAVTVCQAEDAQKEAKAENAAE